MEHFSTPGSEPGVLLVGVFPTAGRRGLNVGTLLGNGLRERGWRVRTVSHRHQAVSRIVDMAAKAWRWRRDYDVAQVDVFSGRAFRWAEAICMLLRSIGKPYVLTLHGGNLPEFSARHPQRVRRLLDTAATVTAPSAFLHRALSCYRDDIVVVPNGVDLQAYRFRLRSRPAPRLVWVRSFHELYNPELALRVVSRLKRTFPEVHLDMVGPDKDGSLERTKKLARALGVEAETTFPGRVAHHEVADWLDRNDLFLNTTEVDNMPLSVIEAMAAGLCIVSTNVGGIPDLLEHERTALLVPPGDTGSMTAAIERILSGGRLARTLSENARLAATRFEAATIVRAWDLLLKRAAFGE